jgi:WD40 repeat protein
VTGEIVWSSKVKVRPQYLLFTPDSSRLITASAGDDVRPHVWEVATGSQVSILDAIARGVKSISVSPDGRLLAFVTYWNDGLFIWDIETSELLASFGDAASSSTQKSVALDFSPFEEREQIRAAQFARKAGDLIIVGKRTIYVVDPRTRTISNHWQYAEAWNARADNILLVSAEAKWAITATDAAELAAFSLTDGHVISRYRHSSKIKAAALTPDDRGIAAISEDQFLLAWTIGAERYFAVPTGHSERVKDIAFSKDGSRLVSFGDKTVRVWDARDGLMRLSPLPVGWRAESMNSLRTHAFVTKRGVAADPTNEPAPEAGGIWSVQRSALVKNVKLTDENSGITAHFSAAGNRVAVYRHPQAPMDKDDEHSLSSQHTHSFEVFEVESGEPGPKLVIRHKQSYFAGIALSNDGSQLGLTWERYEGEGVESQAEAEIWNVNQANKLLRISQVGWGPHLQFSADYRFAVLSTKMKLRYEYARISIWMLDTGTKIAEFDRYLEEPERDVRLLDGSHDRLVLGSANTPPTLKELATGKELGSVASKALGVSRVIRSGNNRYLLVERSDAARTLWNLQSRKFIGYMPGQDAEASSAFFTDDGRRVITTRRIGTRVAEWQFVVEVFDSDTGTRLKKIGPITDRSDLYGGLTGTRVVIKTAPQSIEIHDVDSTTRLRRIALKDRLLRWRLTSSDQRLVTVDESGNLQIWDINSGNLIAEHAGADRVDPLGYARPELHRIPVIMASGDVIVLDTNSGNALWRSRKGINAIGVFLGPDGATLVVREARLIEVFNLDSDEKLESLEAVEGRNFYVNFSDKDNRLFLDARGAHSVLWDIARKKELGRYDNVMLSMLAPNGTALALGFGSKLQVYDGITGDMRHEVQLPHEIKTIQFDESGDILAIATAEPKVITFSVQSGTQKQLASPRHVPTWLRFGASAGELIVYEDSDYLTLRETETGKILTEFPTEWLAKTTNYGWIYDIDPTGTYLAVRTPDNYIRVFRTADGSVTSDFNWDNNLIAGLAFSSNGRRLILATEKGDLLIWDVVAMKGERIVHLDRQYSRYQGTVLRRTNDPAYLLAIDSQGRVDLISMNTFESRLFFSGRPETRVSAALSDDTRILATIGASGVLQVWHVDTRDVLIELRLSDKDTFAPPGIQFSPDGRYLIVSIGYERPYIVKLPLSGATLASAAQVAIARSGTTRKEGPKSGQKTRLGIVMNDVSAELAASRQLPAAEGALIVEVFPDSAALAAGLRTGDVILQVDGKPIKASADVTASVKAAKFDLTLLLLRDGKTLTVQAMLGD